VGALALVLAIPSTANSFTLEQLLDLPVERLLRLEITPKHLPHVATKGLPSPNGLWATEHRDAT